MKIKLTIKVNPLSEKNMDEKNLYAMIQREMCQALASKLLMEGFKFKTGKGESPGEYQCSIQIS